MIMRLISLLSVSAVVVLSSCDKSPQDDGADLDYCESCNLDGQLPSIVAADATDCGRVGLGEDLSAILGCIEQALDGGDAFVARQQLMGVDSQIIIGFAVDAEGVVQRLSYDSNICGGAGGCMDGCGPRVSMTACENPRIGASPEESLVDCDAGAGAVLCEPPQ